MKKSLSKLKDVLDQVLCGAIAPRPILPIWEEMEGEDVCEARIRYAERLCADGLVAGPFQRTVYGFHLVL